MYNKIYDSLNQQFYPINSERGKYILKNIYTILKILNM